MELDLEDEAGLSIQDFEELELGLARVLSQIIEAKCHLPECSFDMQSHGSGGS